MGAVYPNPHLPEYQDSDLYTQDSTSLVTYTPIPLYGQEPDLSRVTYTTGDTDLAVTYASSVEGDLSVKYGNNTAGSSYGGSAGSIDDGSYDEDRPHSVSCNFIYLFIEVYLSFYQNACLTFSETHNNRESNPKL